MKIAGVIARSIFIVTLIAITWSVSIPENMSASALARYSLADYMRIAIGIAMCVGMGVALVRLPKDEAAYKTWTFIGIAIAMIWLIFATLKFALQEVP